MAKKTKQDKDIEQLNDIIEQLFPDEAEEISILALVNWHNLLNHAALQGLDEKHIIFISSLMLQFAAANLHEKANNLSNIADIVNEVSFEESLAFLMGQELDDDDDEGEEEDKDEDEVDDD